MKNKDLVSLNSKVLTNTSIEELEERLELASWGGCNCGCNGGWSEGYGCYGDMSGCE